MNRLRLLIGMLGLVVAMLLPGCRGERASPEAEVRALINSTVTAAEQKSIGTLKDSISEKYADDQGQNKRAVEGLLRLHFLRNETVYLYAHIQSVTLPQPERAQATVLVAMAGVPIASAQELPMLRADLHRFEIDFVRENKTWRVQRAAWRRAELGEFLGP
ncbi:MAG: hypothetical protein AAB174_00910 [Pseudomonadota bacterium]